MIDTPALRTHHGRTLASRALRVLVAEDDPEFSELLVTALAKDGHELFVVDSGHALVRILEQVSERELAEPDVILADVRMPGPSGLDTLCKLQGSPLGARVILMTGFGDQELHARARSAGAYAVFDKPFELDDLRVAVLHVRAMRDAGMKPPG
ncbi:MAG: response regulator [Myxococcales bacterium]|nr:response regulator [Myxococcales bacterium]